MARRGCRTAETIGDIDGVRSPGRLGRRVAPALVRAATGPELLDGIAVLKEACAVFADTDEVGGPDTKMDLNGGSKELGGENVPSV